MHHSVAPRSRKLFACRAIRPGNSERKLALLSAPAGGRRIIIVSFCKPVLVSSPYRSPNRERTMVPLRIFGSCALPPSTRRSRGTPPAGSSTPGGRWRHTGRLPSELKKNARIKKGVKSWTSQRKPRVARTAKVLLKGEGGVLLNHEQEHATLVEHSRNLFAPRQLPPDRTGVQLPLIFTVEEVEAQLRLTKVGRAVPPGIAPTAAWQLAATDVAPLLQKALQTGAVANEALPSKWTDAWIVWLPKQGKAPHIRPL